VLMESALRYDNESIFFLQNEYKWKVENMVFLHIITPFFKPLW
jgi:hypothetical protein